MQGEETDKKSAFSFENGKGMYRHSKMCQNMIIYIAVVIST
jgi:hypothetical protein